MSPPAAVLALFALALLAGPAQAATFLADPQDAVDPAADLRRVGWTVRPAELEVLLETRGRPDTSSWDYVAVLVLGNATEAEPRESYYVAKTLAGGAVAVARHNQSGVAVPRLAVEGERLRFTLPRSVPVNGTAEGCVFALGGVGQFGGANATGAVDTAPDGGDLGAGDPWLLRATLCAPPPPLRTPVPAALAVGALLLAAGGIRKARQRR